MKFGGVFTKPLIVPFSLAVGTLFGLGMVTEAVQAARPVQKIEIAIHNGEATMVHGSTLHGAPTEITVRNEDTDTHGFDSAMFDGNIKVEMTGGSLAEGKGPNVYRVDPGKTMVLKFTLPSKPGVKNRTYAFWCDMHPTMKGEMLVVGAEFSEF